MQSTKSNVCRYCGEGQEKAPILTLPHGQFHESCWKAEALAWVREGQPYKGQSNESFQKETFLKGFWAGIEACDKKWASYSEPNDLSPFTWGRWFGYNCRAKGLQVASFTLETEVFAEFQTQLKARAICGPVWLEETTASRYFRSPKIPASQIVDDQVMDNGQVVFFLKDGKQASFDQIDFPPHAPITGLDYDPFGPGAA